MKTVTSKQFQLEQSKIMKQVANGEVVQVTYHSRPWVTLTPSGVHGDKTIAGSQAAFLESLKYTVKSSRLPDKPDYKKLRKARIRKY